ncbi:hypothetical protein [Peribacillus simplex]
MEGGCALLEEGFVRTKNNVNIIMKVCADLTIGTLWILQWKQGWSLTDI